MRIVINDIAASSSGALSILRDFYNYIVENDKENEWIFLLGDRYIEETENVKAIILEKVKANWINRLIFDFFSGKKYINSLAPDVVLSLQNTITFGLKSTQILYVHQSIPFQKMKKFSFLKSDERILAVYQYIIGFIIKKSIKKANRVIVQTKWMKKAVVECTKIEESKVVNILPNIPDFRKYRKYDSLNRHKFFYPATNGVYKNFKCIYEACDQLIKREVFDYEFDLTLAKDTAPQGKSNIKFLGMLSREEVIEKYNTNVLVFPSFIETVGLPLMEAMQLETIILASDCPFSREVMEDYENAYFFNPFNPKELADLMEKVILGQISKKTIHEKGLANENSWASVIELILGKNRQ